MAMSDENRRKQSERMKRRWQERREEMLAIVKKAAKASKSKEAIAKTKATKAKILREETPEHRAERLAKRKPVSEERKRKTSDTLKKLWEDNREDMLPIALSNFAKKTPEQEERRIASVKKYIASETPEQRAKRLAPAHERMRTNHPRGMAGKTQSPETRAAISKANKKAWAETSPEIKRQRRENHPNWLGGKSYEPYGIDFDKTRKAEVKEIYANKCVLCGDDSCQLSVHHIDYDKQNSDLWNLVPLCSHCHPRMNKERDYWQTLFGAVVKTRIQFGAFDKALAA